MGKGEATCHSSSLYSCMHGRLVDNNQLVVVEEICAVDLQFGQYSIGLEPTSFYDILRCQ